MTQSDLIRAIASRTAALTDDEREGLWNCLQGELHWVERVRRLKGERETLPPARAEQVTMREEEA